MDLEKLKQLALTATPGPWVNRPRGVVQSQSIKRIIFWDDEPNQGDKDEDILPTYEYIAAANPQTILALIERLESAETYLCAISSGNECSACSCTYHGVPDKHFEKYKS